MSTSEVQTFIRDWVSPRIKWAALESGSIRYTTDGKTVSEKGTSWLQHGICGYIPETPGTHTLAEAIHLIHRRMLKQYREISVSIRMEKSIYSTTVKKSTIICMKQNSSSAETSKDPCLDGILYTADLSPYIYNIVDI